MSLSEKLEAARVALGKRKERELQALGLAAPGPAKAEPVKPALLLAPARGGNSDKFLAGQLAHEFLTRGTLLGRRIEPSRDGPVPALVADARDEPESKRRYADVSLLLMTSGARIPGVLNPTQLRGWLQIKE